VAISVKIPLSVVGGDFVINTPGNPEFISHQIWGFKPLSLYAFRFRDLPLIFNRKDDL